ncbi:MAG: hypothetical protein AB1722_01310 [Pseudomonadota bacterium]
MFSKVNNLFILIVGLAGAGLILAGMDSYPGAKPTYFLFCVSFWLMLLTAFDKHAHYGYLFLVVTLWLGFWGKLTAHLILAYPYVEPVGQFDGSAAAWDEVLWVAIVASLGVMLGRLVFRIFSNTYSREMRCDQSMVPAWYPAARKWIWLFAATGMVGVAIANMLLGIQQIGLAPRTILPWPLNGLIAWQVSIGSALLVTVLLWWEVALRKNIAVSIYAPLVEAGLSASSLLSRGIYVFHTLPQLFALFENRKSLIGLSRTKVAVLIIALGCLMMLAIAGVTTFRAYLYPHVGGFTTEEQKRLTRLEVLEGGIANVKKLIANGEPQEEHLRELLIEKAQLEVQRQEARLEVLAGGIAHVKQLILKGEPQEEHLRELLAEKARIEKSLAIKGSGEAEFADVLNELNRQKMQSRLEVLTGGIAHVKELILKGEPQEGHLQELLAEKARIEKSLAIKGSGEAEFADVLNELNRQKMQSRLEVLAGGIAHVKKLIQKGEPQEGHLKELLAEKVKLEKALRNQSVVSKEKEPPTKEKVVQLASQAVQQPTKSKFEGPREGGGESDAVGQEPSVLSVGAAKQQASSAVQQTLAANVPTIGVEEKNISEVPVTAAAEKHQLFEEFMHQVGSGAIYRILSLSVDRWIGLEGVMAVVAYPNKSMELLKEAALEKRDAGSATKFQIVAKSHYQWTDSSQWRFASLPGSAAFLFFSGSMWVVLLGMALFVIVLQLAEQLVFKLTANPLLCSLFGFTLANTIAQFGVAPRQDLPFYAMIVCFVLIVYVVQSDKIYQMIRKHIGVRNERSAA